MKTKLTESVKQAIVNSGLRSGMTISFHHHLRNGDYVLNMVLEAIAELGIGDLTVNASSLFDAHRPLKEHIKNGVVTTLQTDYMSRELGRFISAGGMKNPVQFRTHGGRPCDIENGKTPIDVAFIAAPASDAMGNCTGKIGKSACGSLGYAIPDAKCAKHVVVITDELHPYPLIEWSIPETDVDQVVAVESIGDPNGIVSGTTKITRDPVGLLMAMTAVDVIKASGLLKEGFSFQTGAGGASLAAAKYLKDVMLAEKIRGSFGLGGITGCTHAAVWVRPDGSFAGGAEDVGRHVALDKLLGLRARRGWRDGALVISSRASYEMVQKAAMCGVEIIFAVSAPTALAVELARECGITLAAFCRRSRANVYSHPERLIGL